MADQQPPVTREEIDAEIARASEGDKNLEMMLRGFAQHESGYRPYVYAGQDAGKPQGAQSALGLMQIIPKYKTDFGFGKDEPASVLTDYKRSIAGAANKLKQWQKRGNLDYSNPAHMAMAYRYWNQGYEGSQNIINAALGTEDLSEQSRKNMNNQSIKQNPGESDMDYAKRFMKEQASTFMNNYSKANLVIEQVRVGPQSSVEQTGTAHQTLSALVGQRQQRAQEERNLYQASAVVRSAAVAMGADHASQERHPVNPAVQAGSDDFDPKVGTAWAMLQRLQKGTVA